MANVEFEVTRAALSTAAAGGTQDITLSGFGTPKAAIFIISGGTTDDTITGDAIIGVGFTDGTRENVCCMRAADGTANSDTGRTHRTDSCVAVPTTAGGLEGRFGFNSWITDGVRLDIDDDVAAGYQVTVIFIAGSDVASVRCDHYDDLGTGTSAIDINTVGFEPNLVFMTCTGLNSAPSANNSQAILSFGCATNISAAVTQRVAIHGSNDSSGNQTVTSFIGNDSITGQAISGSSQWDAVIEAFDSSGFSINPNANAGSDVIFYLAIQLSGSPDIDLFDMTWPTSGNYAETSPGFQPTFGLIASNQGPTARNAATGSNNGTLSLMAFNSSTIYTTTHAEDDASATMVSKSLASDQGRILDLDGTNDSVLGTYAFDSAGWDFTLSTNPGTAILGWGLAIRDTGPPAGGAANVFPNHYYQTLMAGDHL